VKMKRAKWYLVLLLAGILFLVGGCSGGPTEEDSPLPPPLEIYEYSDVNIPIEAFQSQPHVDVVMSTVLGVELTVILGSNPTTGYQWTEDAEISDESVVKQIHHVFLSPGPDVPGAPGEEVWVFKPLKRGTTTLLLECSRPWNEEDLDHWTVTITATIR